MRSSVTLTYQMEMVLISWPKQNDFTAEKQLRLQAELRPWNGSAVCGRDVIFTSPSRSIFISFVAPSEFLLTIPPLNLRCHASRHARRAHVSKAQGASGTAASTAEH